VTGSEETGGDTAKTPVGLQRPYGEGEGQQVLVSSIFGGEVGKLNTIGNEVFFAGDRIDGDAFLLPGQGGNGKTADK
jgi:hypothetical protein